MAGRESVGAAAGLIEGGVGLDHAAATRVGRPLGTVVLAALFIFLGAWLAGGGIQRTIQGLSGDGAEVQLLDLLKKLQLVSVGLLATAAGIELLRGRKSGWWLAVVLVYVLFATFVVLASFHRGLAGEVRSLALKSAICGGLLFYFCRPKVRTFFQVGTPTWQTHAAILAACVAAVLALCVW